MAKATDNDSPDILSFALAGLAPLAQGRATLDSAVRERIERCQRGVSALGPALLPSFRAALQQPHERDALWVDVARQFGLTLVELLCLRLTVAAEEDLQIGHAIAALQAPLAGHRPSVSLLAHAFGETLGLSAMHVIGHGAAVRNGMLRAGPDDVPLAERVLSAPLALGLALDGVFTLWPGARRLEIGLPLSLGAAAESYLQGVARQLAEADAPQIFVVRSGEALEARAAVTSLCASLQTAAILVDGAETHGLAAWLFAQGAVPVFQVQLAPGERRPAPEIPGFTGPTLVIGGTDGEFEADGRRIIDWRIPLPDREQRFQLWQKLVPEPLARKLADEHRHSAARIATLAREAHCLRQAEPDGGELRAEHVDTAARRVSSGLGALAELCEEDVGDAALIVPPALKRELEDLERRCRLRDGLVDGLGPALKARYRPAVRVLFVGPSGTGKTLTASWLATRLGLPLYRVDLSAITSKYIGETEKNLSQLLTRAEENEVMILFDEADSLFGKRTEVRDAHDRFANAQTNFLLQRLENYDGIVLLTSNSRARFDAAFSRRLDLILEFPPPGPEERRALWVAHLGSGHALSAMEVNRLAAHADLSGGQIRTTVLSAAIQATKHGGPLCFADVVAGLGAEFRKLGRQLPEELKLGAIAA